MNENIKEYLKAIEAQNNNSLHFDIESYLSYKSNILKAVLELFEDKDAQVVLQNLKEEVIRCT